MGALDCPLGHARVGCRATRWRNGAAPGNSGPAAPRPPSTDPTCWNRRPQGARDRWRFERARAARARSLAGSRWIEAARPDRRRRRIRAVRATGWHLLASGREIHVSHRAVPRCCPVHPRQIDAAHPARRTSRRELHCSHLPWGRDLRPRVRRAWRSRRHGPGPGAAGITRRTSGDGGADAVERSRGVSDSAVATGAVHHPGPTADVPELLFAGPVDHRGAAGPAAPDLLSERARAVTGNAGYGQPRRDAHGNRPDARRGNADARRRHGSTN